MTYPELIEVELPARLPFGIVPSLSASFSLADIWNQYTSTPYGISWDYNALQSFSNRVLKEMRQSKVRIFELER